MDSRKCTRRKGSEARFADVQLGGLMTAGLLSWGSQMCMTQALQMSKTLGVLIVRYTGKPVDQLVSCMQGRVPLQDVAIGGIMS